MSHRWWPTFDLAGWYAHRLIPWRWAIIACSLLLVAVASSGIRYLDFTTNFRMFFGDDNPELAIFDKLQNTYAKDDNILFTVTPKTGDVFTQHTLSALVALTKTSWQIPYARRVDSITNFQHVAAQGDDLAVGDLVTRTDSLSTEELQRLRTIALAEPLLVHRLISPTGHVTGINVTLQMDENVKDQAVPKAAMAARRMITDIQRTHPDLDIRLTGGVMMDQAFGDATEHDMKVLVPVMLTLIIITLGLLLGTVMGTVITLVVLCLSILAALGLAGWFNITLSPSSAAAPNIILTCAVADCVHILANFYRGMRQGESRTESAKRCVHHNLYSMILTCVTTAIGFLTMNSCEVPVFRDLGNITALGILVAFLLSVSLLPALLSVLPVTVAPGRNWSDRAWQRWPALLMRWRRPLFFSTLAVVLALLACVPRNQLNDEFVKYFDHSVDFRQATDYTAENLTGIYYVDYSVGSGPLSGVSDPSYLAQLEAFVVWCRQQPEVVHVYALTDIYKLLNRVMHGDDPQWYRLPEAQGLSAQYLLLYQMSLPYGLDLNDRIAIDQRSSRVTVTLKNLSSKEVLAFEERSQTWLADHAGTLQPTFSGGMTSMFAHIGQRNIDSMLSGTIMGELLISLILIFACRSFKLGVASLIPNLLPALMAFGIWGLLVGHVGMAVSVVASMTLGIVVDDTVHFLTHYLAFRRNQGLAPRDAVEQAMGAVGPASLITGIILFLGFMVLSLSAFEINAGMGLLTGIAIAFATVCEFTLLPHLILLIEERKS